MLDNECPAGLKKVMLNAGVTFQLNPPHLHRTNAAVSAIATYKDDLIAGLSSCDPSFPLHLWDRLVPQATLTLNLLRPSRINPTYLPNTSSMDPSILIARPSLLPSPKSSYLSPPAFASPSHPMASPGGTLAAPLNTTGDTKCTS